MMWKGYRTLLLPVLAALLLGACAGGSTRDAAPTTGEGALVSVVTTSNILGDWVRQVGGERVEVFSLMPVGADPHTFQPGARDVTRVAGADLVLSVGLGLEGAWLDELVKNAAADRSRVVALGNMVNAIAFVSFDVGNDAHDDDEHGPLDPHFWFDPIRARGAAARIADRLARLDPDGADVYLSNARAYQAQLDALHQWIQGQVGQVPPERRLMVTSHDNFGYFADRYGFRIVGAVIPGVTTEQEPSPQEMAALVDEIRQHQAPAIFTDNVLGDRLTQRIAEEAGVKVVTRLHTDSLGGPGSGAETYVGLMRSNVTAIVQALR